MTLNDPFIRYLSSKKSVDDRALNQTVWASLASRLGPATPGRPVRIVEIAAGIGTMVQRLGERGLVDRAEITLVEPNRAYLAESRRRIGRWAQTSGQGIAWNEASRPASPDTDRRLRLTLIPADWSTFVAQNVPPRSWDLVMAHAFLDLADLSSALPAMCRLARPGGLLYLSINYDGKTLFWPDFDPAFERRLLRLYHQSMDQRRVNGRSTGGSRTGRRLFGALKMARAQVLCAGRSDWVVAAPGQGYPDDEAFFLEFILATVWGELKNHPDMDGGRLQRWYDTRRGQIAAGKLMYRARNMDFLAQRPYSQRAY